MKTHLLSAFVICLLCFTPSAFAQINVEQLGEDFGPGLIYECNRFADASANTVSVIDKNGSESFITPAAAKSQIVARIDTLKVQERRLQKRLKAAKKRLKKVKGKQQKKRVRKTLNRFRKQLAKINTQRSSLLSIRAGITDCSGEDPELDELVPGGINLVVRSYVPRGGSEPNGFWMGIFFQSARAVKENDAFCYRASGQGDVLQSAARSIEPCAVWYDPPGPGPWECTLRLTGVFGFQVGRGYTGRDNPGTCFPPQGCDKAEAFRLLREQLASFGEIKVLGKANPRTGCARYQ